MGEREQKGKEGSRMQPYCVSWRDLDSEALVLRAVLRPCFRLRLQHLPPATPVPSSNTPLHTARIRTNYHAVWKFVWKGGFCSPRCLHNCEKSGQYCKVGKKPMTLAQRGALAFGWRNRGSLLFGSHCSGLGHCLHVAVLRTAHSGRQQSRFRRRFLMNCFGTCVPVKHNCLDYMYYVSLWDILAQTNICLDDMYSNVCVKDIYIFSGDNIYSRKRGWILGLLSHPPMVPPVSQGSFSLSIYVATGVYFYSGSCHIKDDDWFGQSAKLCFWHLTSI